MKKFKILNFLNKTKLQNSEIWIAEAKFGYENLKKYISLLDEKSNILEVGCGSGILLSMLAEEFPKNNFIGLEPHEGGFAHLKELSSTIKLNGTVNILNKNYEQHQNQFKYNFIYCVNVFEHVKDWKHFLSWAAKNLKKGGIFFVMCPNYGFPYEPHFRIPIILNKNLTNNVFKKYIQRFETDNQSIGLYNSLNFVKKKQVIKFCHDNANELGFSVFDDVNIIDNLLQRIFQDQLFKNRQAVMVSIARIIMMMRIIKVIKKLPNLLPYMKLIFKKA